MEHWNSARFTYRNERRLISTARLFPYGIHLAFRRLARQDRTQQKLAESRHFPMIFST
ncbi:hypothetical protein KL86PLE_30158 [uncultured Pleomorphomonas sp.]|uniref:Uncharacterized protein n=1 Tax=uncultured Pleomorphomonas sp. TaxID=442121 RepID=A0A212LDU3_9HYPH|nr:hypothetical protein KL86PLE_30158 [uncultured Pleomorphomonas sp.]